MQPDLIPEQQSSAQSGSLYAELMAHVTGLPNDELFAQMISSQLAGVGALPPGLGLNKKDFAKLMARHFPGVELAIHNIDNSDDPRALERADVLALMLEHRAFKNMSEQWLAEIVTTACMANDHLWQDLGLRSRDYLSRFMKENFPLLAARNEHDMKWKKFIYKQLCDRDGVNTCRAPTCEYCVDYLSCFGPED
jgi:nitrogen fixation protein NifQ